jgi:hypothetical protein
VAISDRHAPRHYAKHANPQHSINYMNEMHGSRSKIHSKKSRHAALHGGI